jgi:hypothetical protein
VIPGRAGDRRPSHDPAGDEEPVDRAAGMEIAQNAIPTPAWTAPERRPERPTGGLGFTDDDMHKMTRLGKGGARV